MADHPSIPPSLHPSNNASTPPRLHASPSDNGLGLGQHAFVLFVSVVLSVAIHFGLMFAFGDVGVAQHDAERKRAHITPENLPPVRIEAFVKQTELARATVDRAPDAAAEAERAAAALPARAEAAPLPAPDLPTPPRPQTAPTPGDTLAPPASALPELPAAMLRQEVAAIPDTAFTRTANPDPRWTLDAAVPRIPNAPDLASSAEPGKASALGGLPGELPPLAGGALAVAAERLAKESAAPKAAPPEVRPVPKAEAGEKALDALAEQAVREAARPVAGAPTVPFRAIDDRLNLALSVYDAPADPAHRYFRLDILRRPESALPIMPKDVVFIQDISGSIKAWRLRACKDALKAALFRTLRNGDRFTLFAFRDNTLTPARGWLTFDDATRRRADTFIDSLRALGNTNLFLLLQDLFTLPSDPARPLIAVIITDGEPTVGLTETTRIIGEFSRLNQGRIAVYTFGVKSRNPYFLDMLCYANRGENTTASGDLDHLSGELSPVFDSIRNPVMKGLALTFDARSGGEIHPRHLTHLYADRTLTVYGRVPKSTQSVTCQLRGVSAAAPYDAVFSFDFADATPSRLDLRKAWAERAMFDLLAEYAENPSAALLGRIETFSRTYGVPNPYRKQ